MTVSEHGDAVCIFTSGLYRPPWGAAPKRHHWSDVFPHSDTVSSDAVVEHRGPETIEPTGFGRRGDPGREVEFGFSCAIPVVGVVSL